MIALSDAELSIVMAAAGSVPKSMPSFDGAPSAAAIARCYELSLLAVLNGEPGTVHARIIVRVARACGCGTF